MSPIRLRVPTTYRGRIALAIALVLAFTLLAQALVGRLVDNRVQSAARAALQEQAQLIADDVNAAPDDQKAVRASSAARYLLRTRIVVTWPAPPGLFYNIVPLERRDAEAVARAGEVEVKVARESDSAGVSAWTVGGLLALVSVLAVAVWWVAGSLTRGLVRQSRTLADAAEAISAGDRTVRAAESDDELGRVAFAFNRMAAKLEAADERQRRFLADAAHELRTPVTAIQGFASALTDGVATSDEDRREAAEFIRLEAERLHTLVTDLRKVTVVDLASEVAPGELDLAQVGAETLRRFGPQAAEKGVTLAVEGTARVTTDRAHLDTILGNLVSNALTATPTGGSVRIRAGRDGDVPYVAVIDTGVGIPVAARERIFDRLYRVDTARSRADGGTGLGLAIVLRLVTLLGAHIVVDSTEGKGSTFTIHFAPAPRAISGVWELRDVVTQAKGDT